MAKAVIMAAFMPQIRRSLAYSDAIKKHYSDCDVYIGINSSPPGFEKILHTQGLTNTVRVNPAIEVNSDASAYQAALKLFKEQNRKYETVYFIHTKGASYADDKQWNESYIGYFLDFCKRRESIDKILESARVGGVSYVGKEEPMNGSDYSTIMSEYYDPRFTAVKDIMSLITMYAIKGPIVRQFLDTVRDDFFTDKLDRYFFETSFPLIVDKYGLQREHLVMW